VAGGAERAGRSSGWANTIRRPPGPRQNQRKQSAGSDQPEAISAGRLRAARGDCAEAGESVHTAYDLARRASSGVKNLWGVDLTSDGPSPSAAHCVRQRANRASSSPECSGRGRDKRWTVSATGPSRRQHPEQAVGMWFARCAIAAQRILAAAAVLNLASAFFTPAILRSDEPADIVWMSSVDRGYPLLLSFIVAAIYPVRQHAELAGHFSARERRLRGRNTARDFDCTSPSRRWNLEILKRAALLTVYPSASVPPARRCCRKLVRAVCRAPRASSTVGRAQTAQHREVFHVERHQARSEQLGSRRE
jgi:hypothetical protein